MTNELTSYYTTYLLTYTATTLLTCSAEGGGDAEEILKVNDLQGSVALALAVYDAKRQAPPMSFLMFKDKLQSMTNPEVR